MTDAKANLVRALALEHDTERKLAVVAVSDAEMQRIGFRAVVIGGVAVEFWTRGAYSTADIDEVTLRSGFVVPVLSAADVLVDRLHQFVAGGHAEVAEQAVALLGAEELDRQHLRVRVREERLETALTELERIAGRVESGERMESWELQEIARRLRSPGVD